MIDLDQTFAALSDPTRRAILALLLVDDMTVTDVAAPFAMSLAAISKHLTVLGRAGLITQERRGRLNWCKLEPQAMHPAFVWMQMYGLVEPIHLDGLERFLRSELSGRRLENETDDDHDDDDKADEVDDAIHGTSLD